MVENAIASIPEADIVLYVIDASEYKHINNKNEDYINEENKFLKSVDNKIVEKIKEANKKTILIINKIDLIDKEQLANIINNFKDLYDFKAIIPVSIEKNKNVEDILDEIERNLNEGPAYYDTEEYTDQTLRQLAEEIIREKALKLLNEEVPHGIYVEVDKMKFRKTQNKQNIYDISATIYCLRSSHKGIIIGKSGQMLKKIGTFAREDLEKMLDTKVNLQLWVKVKEDWQNDSSLLKKFKLQ